VDAIAADDLVKTYPGGVRALDGLSFTVPESTIFGLLGPNGAGKTTAVKILTTLARPETGTARVAGFDVLREAARVRRVIGVVQQKHGVDIALTGRENLRLQGPPASRPLHGRADDWARPGGPRRDVARDRAAERE